jgi:outer membrane receptor protein involved in Fe transport
VFGEVSTRWSEKVRSTAGVRLDHYRFDVSSDLTANSGTSSATKASPSLSLVFGPWQKTEFYLNAGNGFHSNDARGTAIAVDPKNGEAVERAPPLVTARALELGVRSELVKGLQSSLSLYRLDFDSELVFVGDAGSTEAGRPSRRVGFEFSNYYRPNQYLTLDADVAFARARFNDSGMSGSRIPGAVEGVASLALALDKVGPWFGALQWRYFGPRPLIEDNSVRSRATSTINGRIGYKINGHMKLELEAFNLANRGDAAVEYFYTSRLKGEAAASDDLHFHPVESRSLRVTLMSAF